MRIFRDVDVEYGGSKDHYLDATCCPHAHTVAFQDLQENQGVWESETSSSQITRGSMRL